MKSQLSFGPFVLDPLRRQLSRGGTPVHLTPRGFDVLWLLASTDGPVHKRTLMDTVWPGLVVEENNLTVTVAAIRRALGDSAKDPGYILTRPGLGYEFVAPRARVAPPESQIREFAGAPATLARPTPRRPRAAARWIALVLCAIAVGGGRIMMGDMRPVVSAVPDVPPAAHRELVIGYNAMYRRTADANREALAAFERAASIQPGPATWSAIAEAYYSEAVFQFSARTPLEGFSDAREFVHRALAVDPEDAHALWLDAALRFYLERDWRGARAAFRHALELNPDSAAARRTFAWLLMTVGDNPAAEEQARFAQRLEPSNANISSVLGVLAWCSGDLDTAMSEFHAAGEMQPGYFRHLVERGRIGSVLGQYDAALADLDSAREHMGDDAEILGSLGFTYARMGRVTDARAMLDLLIAKSRTAYVSPYQFGLIHLGLGDTAAAQHEFQRAYEDRSLWLPWLSCDRRLDLVAGFRDGLLRQLDLPILARKLPQDQSAIKTADRAARTSGSPAPRS
jgi:DNA-binding winged helix-turn-helix (wHTH) protein/tetratricopeptide (TPR) repeat protein